MRKLKLWTLAFLLVGGAVLGACSDDGVDVSKTCSDMCAKKVSCGAESDQAACEQDCRKVVPKLIDKFVSAQKDCTLSHSCSELSNNVCQDAGHEYCTSDVRPMVEALCSRMFLCNGGSSDDVDSCVEQMLAEPDVAFYKCYKPSAVKDYADCMNGLSCDASTEQENACAESALGENPER